MEDQRETVILEIERNPVECTKKVLIENSDYFSAMFKGGFKESFQKTIRIEGVDLKSFNTILLLLWDESYSIDVNEIHLVLQAACMLQFNNVKKICQDRIFEVLNPSICIKIWKTTEMLDISPLWLKAKYMAFAEFAKVCGSKSFLELSLDDICMYLGHVYLNVRDELFVFQKAMNWWYENQEIFEDIDSSKIILKLLNCVDFKKLTDNEIQEMQTYPDIVDNPEIISILNCITELSKDNPEIRSKFSEEQIKYATHLCNSKSRKVPEIPSILLQNDQFDSQFPNKKLKSSQVDNKNVVIYDIFRRRRYLHNVSECPPTDKPSYNINLSAVTYDIISNAFRAFIPVDGDKLRDLAGYKFLTHKEFVFFYGGEYIIGGGNWNTNFWSYDTIKEKWERRSVLPQGRRHFETIKIDNRIYIVGGFGKFRVVQENLLWYDLKSDKWSSIIPLPYNTRNFKCCNFNGELLTVYLVDKRAYFFNGTLTTWRRVEIVIDKDIVNDMGDYAVFSDCKYVYAKGNYLIKFEFCDGNNTLVPINRRVMEGLEYEEIETVLCNNIVYTLYKCLDDHYNFFYTFEALDLGTDVLHYIFRNKVQEKDTLEVGNKIFCLTQHMKLFSLQYYYLVKENIFINDSIF